MIIAQNIWYYIDFSWRNLFKKLFKCWSDKIFNKSFKSLKLLLIALNKIKVISLSFNLLII